MLHRPRQERAGARVLLFRGGTRPALGGQAAHQGRGPADGGELRQVAGAAATKVVAGTMTPIPALAILEAAKPN